jgi:hypothetical protein
MVETMVKTPMQIDTDFAQQADTQPVPPPATAVPQALTRFDAVCRGDVVSLWIDGTPAAHAAEAALLLDRCDALLDALDAWLHMALDWRWVATAAGTDARACAHARCAIESDGSGLRALTGGIELPWAALRAVGAPPDALARQLRWSAAPAVLVVSQPAIDEPELRLLERGGAVVLPESMRAPWRGRLRAADEPVGAGVEVDLLSADSARLPASAVGASRAEEQPACEVRMASVGPLPPEQLAGWAAGSVVELAPRASLWRCAGPTEPERFLAGGRLLPWGDGWAMLVESI